MTTVLLWVRCPRCGLLLKMTFHDAEPDGAPECVFGHEPVLFDVLTDAEYDEALAAARGSRLGSIQ